MASANDHQPFPTGDSSEDSVCKKSDACSAVQAEGVIGIACTLLPDGEGLWRAHLGLVTRVHDLGAAVRVRMGEPKGGSTRAVVGATVKRAMGSLSGDDSTAQRLTYRTTELAAPKPIVR